MPTLHEQEGRFDGAKWNRAVGPFYSSRGLARRLKVDHSRLDEMARTGQILALHTAEGDLVYPTRQFFANEDGTFMVNPAIAPALQFLMEHEEDFVDVRHLTTDDGIRLIDEWTIARTLLQPDKERRILLSDLQQNLDNPEHESWQKLLDLNGIVSGIRRVLSESKE